MKNRKTKKFDITKPAKVAEINACPVAKKLIEGFTEEDSGTCGSNAVLIPESGLQTDKPVKKPTPQKTKLSKRKRRKLEMVLSRKAKKAKRSSVMEQLSSLPVLSDMKLMSVTSLGLKKKKSKTQLRIAEAHAAEDVLDSSSSESESEDSPEVAEPQSGTDDDHDDAGEQNNLTRSETDTVLENTKRRNDDDDEDEPLPFLVGSEDPGALGAVQVSRDDLVQAARLELPILSEEHTVLEAVGTNPACIICGATGSGKTTQVPQFLYEAGYTTRGLIGVTEPRRVAAVSMSKRVAHELNLPSSIVSYQIRYEGNVTKDTKIKFMTDGVLLKEIQDDFLLNRYSVIVVDEAHERSVFTDILIGLLSRILPLRKKRGNILKLVIMSATLRVEDFTTNEKLFKLPPPVAEIKARQFPVTVHFKKRTPADNEYLQEAYKKVCNIHRELPGGAILVFVTGKDEIFILMKWLSQVFPRQAPAEADPTDSTSSIADSTSVKRQTPGCEGATSSAKKVKLDSFSTVPKTSESQDCDEPSTTVTTPSESHETKPVAKIPQPTKTLLKLDDFSTEPRVSGNTTEPGSLEEIESESARLNANKFDMKAADRNNALYVLPLHSMLPTEQQQLVFQPPPPGTRLCVIATNVAETSLTIPGVRYVVDPGKEKKRVYDTHTGVSTFIIDWISQASADQRAGRAGRTGPGHCYRLYSSAVFSEFNKFSPPEILQRPIDDLVLTLKSMGISNVVNFPFPNCPSIGSISAAEEHLHVLGATDKLETKKRGLCYKVTEMGRSMINFPVSPRFAKMLSLSHQDPTGLLPFTVAIVSALTVREIFTSYGSLSKEEEEKTVNKRIRETHEKWRGDVCLSALGDVIVLLNAVIAFEKAGGNPRWCVENGLRYKAMAEISKLRHQLTESFDVQENSMKREWDLYGEDVTDSAVHISCTIPEKLTTDNGLSLRQILLSGLGDKVARKVPAQEYVEGYKKNAYHAVNIEGPVYIHPHSTLGSNAPEFIAFHEMEESSRVYMKECFKIEDIWLPIYCPRLCTFSKPLDDPAPFYCPITDKIRCHMTCSYGNNAWPIKSQEYDHPVNAMYHRLFAKFLLNGDIVPYFKKYSSKLISKPVVMTKSWAKLQPRTESLLQALVSRECYSRTRLFEIWRENKFFLFSNFKEWLPEETKLVYEITDSWPPTPEPVINNEMSEKNYGTTVSEPFFNY